MLRLSIFAAVLAATIGTGSCSMPDRSTEREYTYARADDAEVDVAMRAARDSLPVFWTQYEKQEPRVGPFLLKVGLPTRDDSVEHIWMSVSAHEPKITGALINTPINIPDLARGSTITVTESQISDWAYGRDGLRYGEFTTRVLAKRLSPENRAAVLAPLSPTPLESETR